ncbi:peptidoglycan D,D-transpeptidase FtsI family protein [Georgenia ruanii]|uniref:Penicillin-binding protein n=1 Tax=Georgenia ruanii TaxID=348442 RepID=A0A7J9UXW2_9MICO|nr:penicillin-binding transpeptidase domain-containing protein [Georgenia ruanii]MPV89469.1 penicillin-binding protein [Georgenia ruanii]
MNKQVRHLATVVAVMFLALMVSATSVQFFQASKLNNDGRNVRTVYREFGRDRGPIVVAGEAIASSAPVDDVYGYQRSYAYGPLYAHSTGYFSTAFNNMTGLERSANDVLNGTSSSLLLQRIQTLFTGNQPQGGAVELTLDPAAQLAATKGLGDQRGAVVALDPDTGAILAMVSSPSYDPNALATHSRKDAQAALDALQADEGKPLVNRAIAGDQYAPGSSFKLITASAMLESGKYSVDSMVPAPTEMQLPQSTQILNNPGNLPCGDGSGEVTFTQALKQSCNTPFSTAGMELGDEAMRKQAEAYGFGEPLQVPLKVTASRFPETQSQAELAMASIGQASVRVTPMQMAMVGAAIANGGVQMQPYLVARELTADLEVVSTTKPKELRRPISASTADQLTQMMQEVVRSGTGKHAQIPGVTVAGKTGTAEIAKGIAPHAWFVGFAGEGDKRVAVAVVVENGGHEGEGASGGTTAAPIARDVMAAVLGK